jgi:hypothetical protein
VGGVFSGLVLLGLIGGLSLYLRQRRRRIADISRQKEEVSPFTTPSSDPNSFHDSGTVGWLVTSTTSKSRSRIRNMQPVNDDNQPQQLNDGTNDHQDRVGLPSVVLAQIGDAVRVELAAALRTQARQSQGVRQSDSTIDYDNDVLPPEYFSERGGESGD